MTITQKHLLFFLDNYRPRIMLFSPKLIEQDDHTITFGARKHYGRLILPKRLVVDYILNYNLPHCYTVVSPELWRALTLEERYSMLSMGKLNTIRIAYIDDKDSFYYKLSKKELNIRIMSMKMSFLDLNTQALSMKLRRYDELFKQGKLKLSDKNLDNYLLLSKRIKELQSKKTS